MNGFCSIHSASAQRSRDNFELERRRGNPNPSSSGEKRDSQGVTVRESTTKSYAHVHPDSDFKKCVQAFLVMKVYYHCLHMGAMSLEERAMKSLLEYKQLTDHWVAGTGPFYEKILKVF